MKKDLSVIILIVRNSFWLVLSSILLMFAAESFFFFMDGDIVHGYVMSLGDFVDGKTIGLGLLFGTLRLMVLTSFGSDTSGKETYTLRRLCISDRKVWFWQAIVHTGYYFLIYFAEAWLLISLSRYYLVHSSVQPINNQTIRMALTRNTFLSNLLPLQNPLRILRNFTLLLGIGLTSAPGIMSNRLSKSAYSGLQLLHLLALLVFMINLKVWQLDLLVMIISLLLAGYSVYGVWKAGEKHDS